MRTWLYIKLGLIFSRLRLGLSHLNEHRFNHNFQNCINPLCTCSLEVESTAHFFLHQHHYHNIRVKLLNSLEVIDINLLRACVCYFLSNFYFFTKRQPFKNHEKCCLFRLKSSFHSQDNQIFVIFSLPFHTFQIQKDEWKWNNL